MMRRRLFLACMMGIAAAALTYWELSMRGALAADYTWIWRGANDLLAGHNPFLNSNIGKGHPYPWNAPLYYPLPAVFVGIPTAFMPAIWAGAAFVGISFAALAFSLLGEDPWRLIVLFSAPAFCAIRSAQWSPLLLALALVPALAGVAPLLKPNLGIPLLLWRGQLRSVWIASVVLVISLVVVPSWPVDWLHNLGTNANRIPILLFPLGPLMILALAGWRRRLAWTFLLFALMPQRMIWYDQFPLLMLPNTRRQSMFVVLTSWIGFIGWNLSGGVEKVHSLDDVVSVWVLASLYLPLLLVILWECRPAGSTTLAISLRRLLGTAQVDVSEGDNLAPSLRK